MQQEDQTESTRSGFLERLRAVDGSQSTLAEVAYRRAREALEQALEESRTIRLQAIDDARSTREHELSSLMQALRLLRQSAETQIQESLSKAEIEASRLRDQAQIEARDILERAAEDAAQIGVEAAALRSAAQERAREVAGIEADFNLVLKKIADRLGLNSPEPGWWRKIGARKK